MEKRWLIILLVGISSIINYIIQTFENGSNLTSIIEEKINSSIGKLEKLEEN